MRMSHDEAESLLGREGSSLCINDVVQVLTIDTSEAW